MQDVRGCEDEGAAGCENGRPGRLRGPITVILAISQKSLRGGTHPDERACLHRSPAKAGISDNKSLKPRTVRDH